MDLIYIEVKLKHGKIDGKMNASIQPDEIENFFNRYASRFNAALADGKVDVDKTVKSFASDFNATSLKRCRTYFGRIAVIGLEYQAN